MLPTPKVPGGGAGTEGPAEGAGAEGEPIVPGVAGEPGVAGTADPDAAKAGVEPVISEAMLQHSSAPAMMRALSLVLRWGLRGGILLGGVFAMGYYVVIPLTKALKEPPPGEQAVPDKNAATATKVLHQTRQTVAKNDAKVEYLHSIVADVAPMSEADRKGKAPGKEGGTAETKTGEAVAKPAPGVAVPFVSTGNIFRDAVEKFRVSGASYGDEPRILLDGRLVKYGEIVERELGLRFIGLDAATHEALFTNGANEVFRKAVVN